MNDRHGAPESGRDQPTDEGAASGSRLVARWKGIVTRLRRLPRLRLLDVAALVVAIGVTGVFSVFAYTGGEKSPNVIIEASGQRWIYPLRENRQVTVGGPLGDELISINSGEAWVVTSPCPNKICIQEGRISKPGQWIACLPNKIFIRISGTEDQSVDELSY